MMYATKNYTTKKAFLADVKNPDVVVRVQDVGEGGTMNGRASVAGPWYPQPHKWYASVTVEDGIVVKAS